MSEPTFKGGNALMNLEAPKPKKILNFGELPVTPVETTPAMDSTPVEITPPVKISPTPLQKTSAVVSTPPVVSTPQKGFLRIPNHIVDNILPTLKTGEQAVYLRLYRLSHGHHKPTCRVGLQTLAAKCNLSPSQTRFAVRNIAARGLVKIIGTDFTSKERGTVYEVFSGVETRADVETTSPVETTPNKKNILKKDHKEAPCPDCKGTGWYYPHGVAKGVARCTHESLSKSE